MWGFTKNKIGEIKMTENKIKNLMVLEFQKEIEIVNIERIMPILGVILDLDIKLVKTHNDKIIIGLPVKKYDVPHEMAHVIFEIFDTVQALKSIVICDTHINRKFIDGLWRYSYRYNGMIHSTFYVNSYMDKCYIEDDIELSSMDVISITDGNIVYTNIDIEHNYVNIYMDTKTLKLYGLLAEAHAGDYTFSIFYIVDGKTIQLF